MCFVYTVTAVAYRQLFGAQKMRLSGICSVPSRQKPFLLSTCAGPTPEPPGRNEVESDKREDTV